MSVQYVIDGYNLINHPLFSRVNKVDSNIQSALLAFIKNKRLTGSSKNRIVLVFDGYPPASGIFGDSEGVVAVFSRKIDADEKIKKIVEESGNRRNMIVVSNDKDIKFIEKNLGSGYMSVEDFVGADKLLKRQDRSVTAEPELSFDEMSRINKEFRKLWLKE